MLYLTFQQHIFNLFNNTICLIGMCFVYLCVYLCNAFLVLSTLQRALQYRLHSQIHTHTFMQHLFTQHYLYNNIHTLSHGNLGFNILPKG